MSTDDEIGGGMNQLLRFLSLSKILMHQLLCNENRPTISIALMKTMKIDTPDKSIIIIFTKLSP